MRICLIIPCDGPNSLFKIEEDFPDPARYIDPTIHQFERRRVVKATAAADIDTLCEEGFDIYMNYMWGTEHDNIAGVDAVRYLETKNVPFIGMPSEFLSRNQEDLRRAAEGKSFLVASNRLDYFPKIVSFYNRRDSRISKSSPICTDDQALKRRVQSLETKGKSQNLVVQDYIDGPDFSVIVVDIGQETVALSPLEYHFRKDTGDKEATLTSNGQNDAGDQGKMPYSFVQDEKLAAKLKSSALAAFSALRVGDSAAYARIILRIENTTESVYVVEVNPLPFIFYPNGNSHGDDFIIGNSFPGGHSAFFEVLLSTKLAKIPVYRARDEACATRHDKIAITYDELLKVTQVTTHRLDGFIGKLDYGGTVLDCCSGSGALASFASQRGVRAKFSGVEISPVMASLPACKELYVQPILIGSIQQVLMRAGMHDHVVCFGSFHLFSRTDFISSISQMFMVARISVSFDVDDLSPKYIEGSVPVCEREQGSSWLDFNHNNVAAAISFGVPKGWRDIVYNQRHFAYHSPLMSEDVYTHAFRFERI